MAKKKSPDLENQVKNMKVTWQTDLVTYIF
jgi:hypothetical protein